MIHHTYKLPWDYSAGATLFVFGDLQYGSQGFSGEAWGKFKAAFKAAKNAYAIGLGDFMDYARPTQRARLLGSIANDDSTHQQLDDMVRKFQDKLLDDMSFLEGRLVGLHNGHHCWEFSDGTNSDQRLASALKTKYLGWMASTRLAFETKNCHRESYTMVSMHGQSGGRRTGSHANWLENSVLSSWIADHYIMGHACRALNWIPTERYVVRRQGPPGVDSQLPRCLLVGGFSRGYTDGHSSSYVERAGFAPQPINWGVIRFSFTRSKVACLAKGVKLDSNRTGLSTKVLHVEQFNETP